jgi:chromate transporter
LTETINAQKRVSFSELAQVFLRLSLTAFGGPVAHIAMAEDEIVTRRKWLTRDHYLDLIAATNLIPGPNSTEVMIHVGYMTRGIPGAILAGVCFIGPAFLLTLALAVLYVNMGTIPRVEAILWGIKPVIVAIIANAGYRLLQTALKNVALWVLFIGSVAAIMLLDVPEVVAMLGAGVIYALYQRGASGLQAGVLLLLKFQPMILAAETAAPSLWGIFWYFLKIGSVLFGSGYVLIAYIQQDLVNTFGWLNARQLLDAIAIGQITPGPVSTTTAVIGYILAGFPGAIVGTIGIFLPSFVLVILTAPLIPKMRNSKIAGAFLSGVNAGVIAAILVTLIDLTNAALRTLDGSSLSLIAVVLAIGSLVALIRFKINATWLILIGAVVGFIAGVI